ncbi:MAG: hypothetical protein DRR16_17115 [Candidatus Parabeggiatoa sp. nov. 3]|jgi:hypothetical protein|nr:MAG: hypothetical protein DRR00_12325 [Gammaproteobacteria bacterium]RKZ66661.1 MAG: hypothetical protein DRQ99_09030 [Gammaproteobacteria bacterium]RKZ83525.1 MAG: hypothetical protein DRR16_17115 [Gammaproteobacteria bacterium]
MFFIVKFTPYIRYIINWFQVFKNPDKMGKSFLKSSPYKINDIHQILSQKYNKQKLKTCDIGLKFSTASLNISIL